MTPHYLTLGTVSNGFTLLVRWMFKCRIGSTVLSPGMYAPLVQCVDEYSLTILLHDDNVTVLVWAFMKNLRAKSNCLYW